ncbi:HNH endonuclease [Plantibacter sp. VKM Ac-2885]|nr:HNH endonuclease [Plantibacter sp. VKM Ac-2885]
MIQKGAAWTRNYVEAAAPDRTTKERWRHSQIKDALRVETGDRCAYCEAYVRDVSYDHVEHIRPKTLFPELAHVWTNLTAACAVCNVSKDDYYDSDFPVLNPYTDSPETRLRPIGPLIDWTTGDAQAEISISKLGLNRIELVHSRTRRLLAVRQLLERWRTSSQPLRDVVADAILEDAREGEFPQSVRGFLADQGFPLG